MRYIWMIIAVVVVMVTGGLLLLNTDSFDDMCVYDFTMKDASGHDVPLSNYEGKVVLIVNTATKCGFTPQYEGLQKLYMQYKDQGFEILDFPCNQFGHQAPGSNAEIAQFCQMKYHTTFQTFDKIEVNGDGASPLYIYLKKQKGGFLNSAIKWNFTKFLVNKEGKVVNRYAPNTKPEKIAKDIEDLLKL